MNPNTTVRCNLKMHETLHLAARNLKTRERMIVDNELPTKSNGSNHCVFSARTQPNVQGSIAHSEQNMGQHLVACAQGAAIHT